MSSYDMTSECKIVVLGSRSVGKTALTVRLITDNFLDFYDPTITDSYRKQVMIDDKPGLLDILDSADEDEHYWMQNQWIREGDAFLLVYSISSYDTYKTCFEIRQRILRIKDDEPIIIILAGNKCDLEDQRKVESSDAQKTAKDWQCKFFECSAKTKINHEIIFYECVREIRRVELEKKKLEDNKEKSKKGCMIL